MEGWKSFILAFKKCRSSENENNDDIYMYIYIYSMYHSIQQLGKNYNTRY